MLITQDQKMAFFPVLRASLTVVWRSALQASWASLVENILSTCSVCAAVSFSVAILRDGPWCLLSNLGIIQSPAMQRHN